jgi:hypothetical protein
MRFMDIMWIVDCGGKVGLVLGSGFLVCMYVCESSEIVSEGRLAQLGVTNLPLSEGTIDSLLSPLQQTDRQDRSHVK